MIVFEKIILNNFRRYVDMEFDFQQTKTKNLNIILARNGVGKSTLFDAFTWCLFGTEDHLQIDSKYKKESERIINTKLVTQMKNESSLTVSVVIFAKDLDNDHRYKIKRIVEFYKGNNGHIGDDETQSVPKIWKWSKTAEDWKIEKNVQITIQSIIPKDLRQFFFFDGEQLRSHFESNTNKYLREKIEQVSRVDVIDKTVNNLEYYRNKIISRKRRLSTDRELNKQQDEKGRIERRLNENKKKKSENISRLRTFSQDINKVKIKIHEIGIDQATINYINEMYDQADQRIQELVEEKANLISELNEYEKSTMSIFFLQKIIRKSLDMINTAIERKEAPPPITRDYIERLLDVYKRCICGESLSGKDNPHRKEVLSVLKDTEVSHTINYQQGLVFLDKSLKDAEKLKESIKDYKENIKEIVDELDEEELKKKEYALKRKSVNSSLLNNLQVQLEEFERQEKKLERENETIDSEIEEDDLRLKKTDKEIDKKSKDIKELRELNEKESKAKEIIDTLVDFRTNLIEKNKNELKKKTEIYFRSMLTEKSDEIDQIDIDIDYNLKIVSKINPTINLKHTLSAGETQIFVLAFAAALRDITGINSPLMIDTPLGKIDKEYRTQVLDSFPHVSRHLKTHLIYVELS